MNIKHAEWIGKHCKVISSANPAFEKIEGTIVDETQNTITIETPSGDKKVQKRGTTFQIDKQTVKGDENLLAPQDRIKVN